MSLEEVSFMKALPLEKYLAYCCRELGSVEDKILQSEYSLSDLAGRDVINESLNLRDVDQSFH